MRLRSLALALILPAALLVPIAAFGDDPAPAKKKLLPAAPADQKYDPENITAISEFTETVSKGNEKYVAKDYTAAIDTYRKAMQLAPKNALGPYLLAEAYLANNNLPEADSAIAQAVEIAPTEQKQYALQTRARVLFLRADIFEREKKWEDARTAWQVYVETANKVNADAGAYPNSGTERIKALQKVLDMEKPYAAVRERIAADNADAGRVRTDQEKVREITMSDVNREILGALKIIGAVARADGDVSKKERMFFAEAVTELQPSLPEGTSINQLLDEPSDLAIDLAAVTTPAIRRIVFNLAVAMSKSDGANKAEADVLKQIRAAFQSAPQIFDLEGLKLNGSAAIATPTLNPVERRERVKAVIGRRSRIAGILGAVPLPFVSDVGVLIQMMGVIDDVAMTWGQPLTRGETFGQFGVILSLAMLQGAVHSLIKLIPGWGTVAGSVTGAVASYAVVGAVGGAVNLQFESDGKATPEELRKAFTDHKAEAKKSYEADKAKLDAARATHGDEIAKLSKQLEAKEISAEEYEQKLSSLLGD